MNLFSLSPNNSVEAVMLGNEALLSAFLFLHYNGMFIHDMFALMGTIYLQAIKRACL